MADGPTGGGSTGGGPAGGRRDGRPNGVPAEPGRPSSHGPEGHLGAAAPEGLFWSYELDVEAMLAAVGGAPLGDPADPANEEAWQAAEEALADAPEAGPRDLTGVLAEQLPAGPGLAGWLASAEIGELADWDLPGVAAAYRRLASWAQAQELTAIATMASRAAARDPKAGVDAAGCPARVTAAAATEVSLALTMSQYGASWWTGLGVTLRWRLPDTDAALHAGTIDLARARLIAEAAGPLDPDSARAVEALVLPGAGGQTTGQLRVALRRAVLAVDPRGAEERRRSAERRAKVGFYPDQSGTAALIGSSLPGVRAAAAMARLTAMAWALKAGGAGGRGDLGQGAEQDAEEDLGPEEVDAAAGAGRFHRPRHRRDPGHRRRRADPRQAGADQRRGARRVGIEPDLRAALGLPAAVLGAARVGSQDRAA